VGVEKKEDTKEKIFQAKNHDQTRQTNQGRKENKNEWPGKNGRREKPWITVGTRRGAGRGRYRQLEAPREEGITRVRQTGDGVKTTWERPPPSNLAIEGKEVLEGGKSPAEERTRVAKQPLEGGEGENMSGSSTERLEGHNGKVNNAEEGERATTPSQKLFQQKEKPDQPSIQMHARAGGEGGFSMEGGGEGRSSLERAKRAREQGG